MKKLLFIDRDGTIIREPADEQIDSFEKLQFVPRAISSLAFLRQHTDYEFVMVSNQDGLGTDAFPEDTFWPVQNFILDTLRGEGITFDDILIDPHFPEDNAPTRKPNTGLVQKYIDNPDYDIAHSYVIGDRDTDRQFAANIGCGFLRINSAPSTPTSPSGSAAPTVLSGSPAPPVLSGSLTSQSVALQSPAESSSAESWQRAVAIAYGGERTAEVRRTTKETDIYVKLDLDGNGHCDITTGLGFFDHMLEQIGKHGMIDLTIHTKGDLHVDEHHTIEDTALALGECLLHDFGGRPWLVWDAEFHRERIGEMPTEMFLHFFKSLSDAAKMNLNIRAEGDNEHHKIEGIFKALARALKMAVRRDVYHYELPSTKGTL